MKKTLLLIAAMLLAISAIAQTTPHTVTLTWTPSVPSTEFPTSDTGYNVYRGTTSGAEGATPITPLTSPNGVTCTTTLCTYVDTASSTNVLTEGDTYFYNVKAVSLSQKVMSVASNETSATIPKTVTAPAQPQNLNSVAK